MGFDDELYDSNCEAKLLKALPRYSLLASFSGGLDEATLAANEDELKYDGYSHAYHTLRPTVYECAQGWSPYSIKDDAETIAKVNRVTRHKVLEHVAKISKDATLKGQIAAYLDAHQEPRGTMVMSEESAANLFPDGNVPDDVVVKPLAEMLAERAELTRQTPAPAGFDPAAPAPALFDRATPEVLATRRIVTARRPGAPEPAPAPAAEADGSDDEWVTDDDDA